jgi:hypothetical protein
VTEHRSTERGLYDRLQLDEHASARELLERLLAVSANTYEQICIVLKGSGLFEDLKDVTPQDLTRYRQRKSRAESRASVKALIEQEGETLVNAAAQNPTGMIAKYLRRVLTEHAVTRFDAEIESLNPLEVSKEAARHALVEQRDRKLDLDEERAALEKRRIELAERQAELQRDKFGIAAKTWRAILTWCAQETPSIVETLTQRSDELLAYLEEVMDSEAA